jgi:hypothetical protein
MNEFDEALLSAIDAILRYAPGALAHKLFAIIQNVLLSKNLEIPKRLDRISEKLKNLLDDDRGQILDSAALLRGTTAERTCYKLGTKV